MAMSSSSSSEGKAAKRRDPEVTIPGFESKSLYERIKEYREAEKAAKEEGLPRAQAKHFFVRLQVACLMRYY
jgi:hypothetical protein